MEKITLEFSAQHPRCFSHSVLVAMTLNENGRKGYSIDIEDPFPSNIGEIFENLPLLPKRVITAFTESAINKILSKDEIPNESGWEVFDGYIYEITITKGNICKKYHADDANIETYPLLRYLAIWCRKH